MPGGRIIQRSDTKNYNASLYNLVEFGFTKPVFAKHTENHSWEINFGAATFTQFDLIRRIDGSFLAGLMNNDYKVSIDLSLQKKDNVFRFRIFHLSSHLGDDYMARHNDTIVNNKSDNYEQADFTFLHKTGPNYWYAGAGEIYTIYSFRKRFSLFGGGMWTFGKSEKVNFFGTFSLKLLQENNFYPDFRDAYGINFCRNKQSFLKIWIEFYSGHLPYSTINYGKISWVGAGMTIPII